MNNMNGIISECQHIYNSEVEIKDTKNKSNCFLFKCKSKNSRRKRKTRELTN